MKHLQLTILSILISATLFAQKKDSLPSDSKYRFYTTGSLSVFVTAVQARDSYGNTLTLTSDGKILIFGDTAAAVKFFVNRYQQMLLNKNN